MFSAKLYIKYPQSTFIEDKDGNNYLGTYTVTIPCDIFSDEELLNKVGNISFNFKDLTVEDCTPEHIYGLVMSQFEDSEHIS